MKDFSKIEETVIMAGNYRMNISSAGVWIDDMGSDSKTAVLSTAMAWEEMTEDQVSSYMSLYIEANPSLEFALTG
jgi:hypothetical protein